MAKFFDVFNGDADGLCALHQLRLEAPCCAELITGVKRDIELLVRADAGEGDELMVLDISMKRNAPALERALARGAHVRYFDHHEPGNIPRHPGLEAHIDTSPGVCTGLIVDRYLGGRQRLWAVVAAFGDNLVNSAVAAAQPLHLDGTELARLQELGECLNYNAYGETLADLHYHPADLYRTIARYRDPRHFAREEPVFPVLRDAYAEDLRLAGGIQPYRCGQAAAMHVLPDAAWSRRIHGLFGNRLAQAHPEQAHAVLVSKPGGYLVSVRAPMERPAGAGALCEQFKTGGGRQGAAGIDWLPANELERFASAFERAYRDA